MMESVGISEDFCVKCEECLKRKWLKRGCFQVIPIAFFANLQGPVERSRLESM